MWSLNPIIKPNIITVLIKKSILLYFYCSSQVCILIWNVSFLLQSFFMIKSLVWRSKIWIISILFPSSCYAAFIPLLFFSLVSVLYGSVHEKSPVHSFCPKPSLFSSWQFFHLFLASNCSHAYLSSEFQFDCRSQYPCFVHSFYMAEHSWFSSNSVNRFLTPIPSVRMFFLILSPSCFSFDTPEKLHIQCPSNILNWLALLACMLEMLSLNLTWDIDYPDRVFVLFLSLSRQMPEQCFKLDNGCLLPHPWQFIIH